jgi:putative ABC transport system permease protein
VQEAAIGRRQSEWADRPRVDPIVGLRRALGAHRGQIRIRFLAESIALAVLGGSAGALLVGVVAGVYPAMRAARLAPTEALAAP